MAVVVDNLLRKLEERINYASSLLQTSILAEIKTQLQKIQPFLEEAEWIRDMEGGDDLETPQVLLENAESTINPLMVRGWLLLVTNLVHEVEDVIDTCYLHSFDVNINTVSGRISQFLSTDLYHLTSNTQDVQTVDHQGLMHLINCCIGFIRTLVRSRASPDLFRQFSEKVAEAARVLVQEARKMHLRADSQRRIAANMMRAGKISTKRLLQSARMVGRETELQWLEDKLQEEGPSLGLVGVVGPTGIGKQPWQLRLMRA
ncbi:hypothetical protein RJ641_006404 [Dillenia turbinata]|uniref:Uncharacterized protein n=1 Tax=Dillenia turbinata TaxID=194707 RepID=A0AAN8ZBR7_9MAGN